jgi:hypothetical protein
MHVVRILALLVATTTLTACLNSTTVVRLKPDGSGTIEQTTLVNAAAIKGLVPGAAAQPTEAPAIDREDFERAAAGMGSGVRLVSVEKATGEKGFEGTKAIFAFDDINLIRLSQDAGASDRFAGVPTAEDPVKFKFMRGATSSTLTIDYIDRAPAGSAEAAAAGKSAMPDLTNPMIMGMLKTVFQGAKIHIDLEVAGNIVKTNAEYVSGPRITLLEMDIAAILSDEAKLKALQGKIGPDASLTQVKPYLKDIKGIKIDGPSISVEFR